MTLHLQSSMSDALYSVAAVRGIDRTAIDERGIPGYELMTRAGAAAVGYARRRFPGAVHWVVVCGGGNNAGDGYVVARLAAEAGLSVTTIALTDPASLKGDAAKAYADFTSAGLRAAAWQGHLPDAGAPETGQLVIDALLGSGLQRDVEGNFRAAVEAINQSDAPVLALDIATGLDGDSGQIHGVAVRADATLTFVGRKVGLYLGSGPDLSGDIAFADLDIPADCHADTEPEMRLIPASALRGCLPRRRRDAHKGSFGHVVIVGGCPGMPGAVRLAGEAALRTGAGLVSVATHPQHAAQIVAGRPELMVHSVDGVDGDDNLSLLLERASVIAVGPGLGQSNWSRAMLAAVLDAGKPLVADADALNLIANTDFSRPDSVITPHPGEAARLLDESTAEVQGDRVASVRALAERYGATAVLKGAGSLISAGSAAPWLCVRGNPGMAAPGMGDALTGIVAALMAQGFSAELAAICGVEIHARAGDLAAASGQRGLIASDLIAELRVLVNP